MSTVTKKQIATKDAPEAIGPYSQAISAGQMVFLSGQIALDPKTGEIVEGGVKEQTKQVMENLSAVLKEAGLTFDNVVKTTIYLTDLNDFVIVNKIYGDFISEPFPARARKSVV